MPKRGNGQGSLQQRRNRWVAALTLGRDHHDKVRRLVRTFTTEQEPSAWLTEHTRSQSGALPVELEACHPDVLAYSTFLHEWLAIKRHHVREKTWRDYERVVRLHLLRPAWLTSRLAAFVHCTSNASCWPCWPPTTAPRSSSSHSAS